MSSFRIVIAVSVALVGVGAVPAVHGQETKQPPPDIRMLLTQPKGGRAAPNATSAPDLRDLPQPKMDKPPVEPPITIVVGDPRCYPGEDGIDSFAQANRRRRR